MVCPWAINSEMRSLFTIISTVVLVCFVDQSYETFVDFLSNLPMEISRAFSVAWESMEDAIKQPVQIIRIGSGGKLKTTTVSIKNQIHREQKNEWVLDRRINWQPEQQMQRPITRQIDRQPEQKTEWPIMRRSDHQPEQKTEWPIMRQIDQPEQKTEWPSSRRVEWHLTRQPYRKFEQNKELKRKLDLQSNRKLELQSERQHELQLKQPLECLSKQKVELQSERKQELQPLEWQSKQKLELQLKRKHELQLKQPLEWQYEQKLTREPRILEQNHHEPKLEWHPQLKLQLKFERNHDQTELYPKPQPKWPHEWQPEWQSNQVSSGQSESKFDITQFIKSRSKLTIPFLEKPENGPMSNNIMRVFHGRIHQNK